MKVLITGGAGFIGTNLTLKCIDMGWETTIIDSNLVHIERSRPLFRDNCCILHDDFASSASLKIISKYGKFDVIFHQAAVPRVSYSVEHPAETTEENVLKTVRLLEAAAGNCRRFIFASSSSVYGDTEKLPISESIPLNPISPYALQKKVGEEFIRLFCNLYGLDAVCLRYFNVFGPHQYGDSAYSTAISSWCHKIKNKLPLRKDGSGEQSRDMCFVDNVVHANILASQSNNVFRGEAVNIACGDRVTNNEILSAFERVHPNMEIIQSPFRAGDIMHTQADISLAKQMIAYEPKVRFWEGFEKTLEWWDI